MSSGETSALPDDVTVGEALRTAREASGQSVEQVSATTRIRGTLVRDLEADRFDSSGGAVYARGHIRALALAAGADPAPYVALFARQAGAEQPGAAAVAAAAEPVDPRPVTVRESLHVPTAARPERRGPNWLAAGAAALGVLVALFVVGQFFSSPSSGSLDTAQPRASVAPHSPAPSPSAPPKDLTAAVPPPTGADLRVRLLGGASYILVKNSAGTLFEGVVNSGWVKDFKDARQLQVRVGNAGAVNLVCSGRDLGTAGGNGAVRQFTCNADGIVPA
jgi:cytoskeleton protein RodZ